MRWGSRECWSYPSIFRSCWDFFSRSKGSYDLYMYDDHCRCYGQRQGGWMSFSSHYLVRLSTNWVHSSLSWLMFFFAICSLNLAWLLSSVFSFLSISCYVLVSIKRVFFWDVDLRLNLLTLQHADAAPAADSILGLRKHAADAGG